MLLIFSAIFCACSPADKQLLQVRFNPDSSLIIIRGVDPAGLLQLKQAGTPDSLLSSLVSILQTPSEHESSVRELPVTGHFLFKGDAIVFRPDSPFVKDRDYLVITHLNTHFGDFKAALSGQLDTRMKPFQKQLSR